MRAKARSIVRLQQFKNHTRTGRPSATGVRKLAMYIAYGRGGVREQVERPQRGQWLGEKGQAISHEKVMIWVQQEVKNQVMTYEFILSFYTVHLTPASYWHALQAHQPPFGEWRLLCHDDTNHSHAHLIAFGVKEIEIKEPAFQEWCQAVRHALAHYQDIQLEEDLAQRQQEQILPLELESKQHGWGLGF